MDSIKHTAEIFKYQFWGGGAVGMGTDYVYLCYKNYVRAALNLILSYSIICMSAAANKLFLFYWKPVSTINFFMSILAYAGAQCLKLVYKITASIVHKYSIQGNVPVAVLRMVHACTGIPQYYAWNTPVPRMEYACIIHGICLYHAWNTPGICKFLCIFHAWNMHEI